MFGADIGYQVLSHEKLRELKRIPRSSENHQEDALAAVECCGEDQAGDPLALIFFFSHRWRRPNWCRPAHTAPQIQIQAAAVLGRVACMYLLGACDVRH